MRVMAGKGKLPAGEQLKATRSPGHHDETVGGSDPGDSVPMKARMTRIKQEARQEALLLDVQVMPRWSASRAAAPDFGLLF